MRLAVIGTFHKRHENTLPLLRRVFRESSRVPDETWVMCEDEDDKRVAEEAVADLGHCPGLRVVHLPTERKPDGRYAVIPYSNKINWALRNTGADMIVYLDNGSMPHPDKYRLMAEALEEKGYGAVYCGQLRGGYRDEEAHADKVVQDGYCAVNYTQVMHRHCDAEWPLEPHLGKPDLADANFWRELHKRIGHFYPVGEGLLLDEHHLSDAHVEGL